MSGVYDWIQLNVCILSDNPPAYCGAQTTSTGQERIRVDVQYGVLPKLTSWSISDSSGDIVATSKAGSITSLFVLVSTYLEVNPGLYVLELSGLGDGAWESKFFRNL